MQAKPISSGTQTFSILRENDYTYVDKTGVMFRMTSSATRYFFLARPRRFGKSLLVSTLKAYFEGRRELFKGLAIDALEREWTVHPVLHFDFSTIRDATKENLESELIQKLVGYEDLYGRRSGATKPNQRLGELIVRAHEQTGQKVVLLVDEYDAPILNVLHEGERLEEVRNAMRNFYSPIKACDSHLRFVFLTGITKFSQLSIFSELNNIKNVSMLPEFAALCGITEEEMTTQLAGHIEALAKELEIPHEKAVSLLRDMYDGYRFAWPSPGIYNPYSLLNALADKRMGGYWFESGTPAHLIQILNKFGVVPQEIGRQECRSSSFDAPTENLTTATPLLYQSGYLTIKNYDKVSRLYTLDYPNAEVRLGLAESLLVNYVKRPDKLVDLSGKLVRFILNDDMDGALRLMQETFATIPYCSGTNTEGHYQAMLLLAFTLLGFKVGGEVRTSTGRLDAVLFSPNKLYLFELKIDGTAKEALAQIDEKRYAERFALDDRPKVKVGLTFSTETRTLGEWIIE